MMEKGYTRKQVRLLCEWYLRVRKSSYAKWPGSAALTGPEQSVRILVFRGAGRWQAGGS
jgi:hypothetical protein